MTQPINLRQFRKKKAREDKAKQAETNRVQFGTPKAQRAINSQVYSTGNGAKKTTSSSCATQFPQ